MAGFTFGVTQSFYDFYSQSATSFFGGMINPASDTGDAGEFVFGAYTAQFGNGLSATLALENPRTTAVLNGSQTTMFRTVSRLRLAMLGQPRYCAGLSAEAIQWPDIVANLRIDQTWGSAQIMGAIHNASASYYGTASPNDALGHPGDAIGWAVGARPEVELPDDRPRRLLPGSGQLQRRRQEVRRLASYTQHVLDVQRRDPTASVSAAMASSAAGTGIELTTAWGVNAAYEHFWNKRWQTSVYGAYTATSYDATANLQLCTAESRGVRWLLQLRHRRLTCDNNFQTWTVGTRTQFNLDCQTYIGVDVVYQKLQTALAGIANTATVQKPVY